MKTSWILLIGGAGCLVGVALIGTGLYLFTLVLQLLA